MLNKKTWQKRLNDNKDDILIMISFCQLIEKIIRFKNFLKKATYAVELSEPKPKIIDYLDELIDSNKKELMNYIALYSEDYENISKNRKEDMATQLLASSLYINENYIRDLQWVFCPWPEKVSNDFLKQIFKEAKYDGIFKELNGTIVLINEYNFWQYAPYKKYNPSKGIKNHIFGLPKIELENCFLWQTLVHEVGHALIEEFRWLDTDIILDSDKRIKSDKQNILENWIKEFGSDLIALKTIGPSYLITLITYSITNTEVLWRGSDKHPPIKLRIDFMFDELARTKTGDLNVGLRNYLTLAKELFYSRLIIDTELMIADERMEFESEYFEIKLLEKLYSKCSEKLEKSLVIEKFSKESFEKSHILAKRLSDGILISSSSKNSHAYIEIEENNLNERIEELNEYPNKMTEIITAATLCKWDSQIDWLLDSFFQKNKSEYEKCFENYAKNLEDFDIGISKSIETALIHSYFVNGEEFKGG